MAVIARKFESGSFELAPSEFVTYLIDIGIFDKAEAGDVVGSIDIDEDILGIFPSNFIIDLGNPNFEAVYDLFEFSIKVTDDATPFSLGQDETFNIAVMVDDEDFPDPFIIAENFSVDVSRPPVSPNAFGEVVSIEDLSANDLFDSSNGVVTVEDFSSTDVIDLSGLGVTDFSSLEIREEVNRFNENYTNLIVSFQEQDIIKLGTLDLSELSAENFTFYTGDVDTISSEKLRGSGGSDMLHGDDSGNKLSGRGGDDTLLGFDGTDNLKGGGGDDILSGGASIDTLRGGGGDDILLGGSGDDVLRGGRGDDVLYGGRGIDILLGGRGRDIMVASNNNISGFNGISGGAQAPLVGRFRQGRDKIDVSLWDVESFEQLEIIDLRVEGLNVTGISFINDDNGNGVLDSPEVFDSIILAQDRVSASDLTAADFIFTGDADAFATIS